MGFDPPPPQIKHYFRFATLWQMLVISAQDKEVQ